MENASKALIIAGAILISILIIGLGVYIYSNASSSIKKADLSSTEAQAHNGQFTDFFGNKESAAQVKQLMTLVRNNNITGASAEQTQNITVFFKQGNSYAKTDPSTVSQKVKAGKTYYIGTLNDNASTTDDGNVSGGFSGTTGSSSDEPCYYSSGYLRIINISEN